MNVTLKYKTGVITNGFKWSPFRRDDNQDGSFTWFLDDRKLTGFHIDDKTIFVEKEELDEDIGCPF